MLTTNCPACMTTFRITAEQLKARAGKVRCGQCQTVFNALESLSDLPDEAPAKTGTPPASETLPHATPTDAREAPAETVAKDTAASDILLADLGAAPAPVSRGRSLAWGSGVGLLLLLALLQAGFYLRAELAASLPHLRPLLEAMCERLECDVPLPRKSELVSIESSDLHPDPQRKALLVLAASLKNRAPFPQDYPHLELTLTDTHDQAIARRVFAPAEYLPPGMDRKAGFAANGELAVNLWLQELPGASGYRLYLFYP